MSVAGRTIRLVAIELSDELVQLETKAWEEIQAKVLSVETAVAVQAAITAHATATEQSRYAVEMELKRLVRRPAAQASD